MSMTDLAPPPPSSSTPDFNSPPQTARETPVDGGGHQGPSALTNTPPEVDPGEVRRQHNEKHDTDRKNAIRDAAKKLDSKPETRRSRDEDGPESSTQAKQKEPQQRQQGRFAKAPDQGQQQIDPSTGRPVTAPAPGEVDQNGQQAPETNGQQNLEHYREAPRRWSPQAQQEWASTPESVRASVHQSFRELETGLQHYKTEAESFAKVKPFAELAKQHGTTLDTALSNYVGMEQHLRKDLIGGLDKIIQNMGMKNTDGSPTTLRDVAYHIANMSPDQISQTSQRNQAIVQESQIGQLTGHIQTLAQTIQQMQDAARQSEATNYLDRFAEKNPHFKNIAGHVLKGMELGYTFEQAYAKASEFIPPTATAAQTRTHPAQTRNGDSGFSLPSPEDEQQGVYGRSISGAPNGSQFDTISQQAPMSRADAIKYAMRRVGNR